MKFFRSHPVLLFCLCLGHCLNDFIAGFLINKNGAGNFSENFVMVAVYGIIAFGGQLPLALLIDRFSSYRNWSRLAVILNLTAILISFFNLSAGIIFSRFASAIYHVSVGAIALQLENKYRVVSIGSFAAPGVIGLTIGTIINPQLIYPLLCIAPALVLLFFIFSIPQDKIQSEEKNKNTKVDFEWHDAIMLLILVIAALRSAVWDIFQELHGGNNYLLLKIAFAAATGKFLGGFLSTRIHSLRYINFSMILSIAFLHFAEKSQNALLAGIVLLQSGIPASILILKKYFPEKYGFANAAILGLAVFIGAVVYNLLPGKMEWIMIGILLICVLYLPFSFYRKKMQ